MSAPAPELEEAIWLDEIARGNEPAFVALYERFSVPLFSLLYQMLRNRQDAEEVLQASFLEIWKRAAAYDASRCGVFTWLVLIVRSRAIDRLRQRQRQSRLLEAAQDEELLVPVQEYGDGPVALHENAGEVRAALARLPVDQREAIELAFFRGLSQSEVAEALAQPLGTVKARIRRGLLRLRDTLVRRL